MTSQLELETKKGKNEERAMLLKTQQGKQKGKATTGPPVTRNSSKLSHTILDQVSAWK